jgi:hypothetical protein
MVLECHLSRRTGKVVEARTQDLGPGGMRIVTTRPLATDEVLDFEMLERPALLGRVRVLRETGHYMYALRFERLSEEARAEIAGLARER